MENWFEVDIYTKKPSLLYRDKFFSLIRRILNETDCMYFHFFHEDWDRTRMSKRLLKKYDKRLPKEKKGYMFLFRIRVDKKENIKTTRESFERNKKLIRGIYKKLVFPEYHGEAKFYSKRGWEWVQQYFYICSVFAIEKPILKGEWMNIAKLNHTLLNQYGYSHRNEFLYHFERASSIYNNLLGR